MNVKFLLFCIASLGSLMMLYMWFSANSTIKDTQNSEEQYVYRISSLKSEIEVEKRLMESLRKDVKNYANNIAEKTSLIDRMNKKGVQFDKEKVKLEKEMETLRSDINKITNSNDEEKKRIESEYEITLKDENSQIDSLENEIKKLTNEKKDLMEKQSKINKNTKNPAQNDKIPDNTMQGKAPKIKESKVDDIQSGTKRSIQSNDPDKHLNQNQNEPKNDPDKHLNQNKNEPKNDPDKHLNQNKNEPKDEIKMKPDSELKKPLAESNDIDFHDPHIINKAANIKPVRSNDVKNSKEDFPVKDNEKSKLNQAKDNSQQFPPDPVANDLNIQRNRDSQHEQINKKNFLSDHQLKPPKNEKDIKDDYIKGGMLLKNQMKKDLEKDI